MQTSKITNPSTLSYHIIYLTTSSNTFPFLVVFSRTQTSSSLMEKQRRTTENSLYTTLTQTRPTIYGDMGPTYQDPQQANPIRRIKTLMVLFRVQKQHFSTLEIRLMDTSRSLTTLHQQCSTRCIKLGRECLATRGAHMVVMPIDTHQTHVLLIYSCRPIQIA